ncbi:MULTISPECIES: CpsB/CapC family capsule biosynthesis tyrosine phosphatase [Peribacillus]|uniref:Tyrosine-protein phosphatase n=1 Tax=Peribacillus simplex TaxID=1478 RepID=A0A109MVS8_9BACI|nr:CpsB/CapC family capsule biosynthesis tyrosine phosphatase [Peribacillus simplex]KWW16565.1 tyrosine protein phosphatase [Peribacillus simplex]
MIDIHSHILPELDDGAGNIKESVEMARKAVEQGITDIIATPHYYKGKYDNDKEKVERKTWQLNRVLDELDIPLKVWPGQEIRISDELLEDYDNNSVMALNGSQYMLLELPSNHVPRYTERLIYDLQMKRITPIIAHPERNLEIIRNPHLLEELIWKGAYSQLTAGSITGKFGWRTRRFSKYLIHSGLTHFIASDAHNVGNRGFQIREAYKLVEKNMGQAVVNAFHVNAENVLYGMKVKESFL